MIFPFSLFVKWSDGMNRDVVIKSRKYLGMGCGVLTGLFWGISGVFSQYLFTNTDMESGWFVAVRMLIAGIILMFVTGFTKSSEVIRLWKCKKDLGGCLVMGIFGVMLFQFFCYGAVQRSNAATAIVLQYLCPAMIMVYKCIFCKKMPKKYEIVALVLAVGGVFIISTHGNISKLVITKDALLWGIGSAFFMSVMTLIPENLYKKYSTQTVSAFSLLFGGIAACFIVKPWKQIPVLDMKAKEALLFAILFGCVFAYMVYSVSVKMIGSSRASLFACFEIPAATILSVVLLGCSFTWMDILGFLLIGSTIFILSNRS